MNQSRSLVVVLAILCGVSFLTTAFAKKIKKAKKGKRNHRGITNVRQVFRDIPVHPSKAKVYQLGRIPKKCYTGDPTNCHFQGSQRISPQKIVFTGSEERCGHLIVTKRVRNDHYEVVSCNNLSMLAQTVLNKELTRLEGLAKTDKKLRSRADQLKAVVNYLTRLNHAGGFQAIKGIAAIPYEGNDHSAVLFADLNTEPPKILPYAIWRGKIPSGATAIYKQNSGRFILAVGRADSNIIDFYQSTQKSLQQDPGFTKVVTWSEKSLKTELGKDREFGNYQSLSLLQDNSGNTYLVGIHRNTKTPGVGQDWADMFRVKFGKSKNGTINSVEITKIIKKHLYTKGDVNCDSAPGLSILENKGLSITTTSHYLMPGGKYFLLNEWHNIKLPALYDIRKGWVKLYDDKDFTDRCLYLKDFTKGISNYKNIKVMGQKGFNDKVSSAEWYLPKGYVYTLYENDNYRGRTLRLVGTGEYGKIRDLGEKGFGFNDKTSSSQLVKTK